MPKPLTQEPWSYSMPFRFNFSSNDPMHKYANQFGIIMLIPLGIMVPTLSFGLFRKTKVYLRLKREAGGGGGAIAGGAAVYITTPAEESGADAAAAAAYGTRSIEALVNFVTDGQAGITPSQRDFSAKMIAGLGYATEADLAAEFRYIEWGRHMPGFPARVEFRLKMYFDEMGVTA